MSRYRPSAFCEGTLMPEIAIALFCEDLRHEQVLEPLVSRIARERGVPACVRPVSARGGGPRALAELAGFVRDVEQGRQQAPGVLVAGVDANCHGRSARLREVRERAGVLSDRVVAAIPDPHIERWLLADPQAFKLALGRGCSAPDQKCDADRYKQLLGQAIADAGVNPTIGGLEWAADIVANIDLDSIYQCDQSLGQFVRDLRALLVHLPAP